MPHYLIIPFKHVVFYTHNRTDIYGHVLPHRGGSKWQYKLCKNVVGTPEEITITPVENSLNNVQNVNSDNSV